MCADSDATMMPQRIANAAYLKVQYVSFCRSIQQRDSPRTEIRMISSQCIVTFVQHVKKWKGRRCDVTPRRKTGTQEEAEAGTEDGRRHTYPRTRPIAI